MFSINHFMTYDGHRYDWNGVCNYTLTQRGTTYNPDLAVFMDMEQCGFCGACPGHTTFKNDKNTVIRVSRTSIFDVSLYILELLTAPMSIVNMRLV